MTTSKHRNPIGLSRRDFLRKTSTCSTGALALGAWSVLAAMEKDTLTKISDHVYVAQGPINVGVIRDGEKAWLIDCGIEAMDALLRKEGITQVERILFTHHHRDQAVGAGPLVESGAKIYVPAGEKELFADPKTYWNNDSNCWGVSRSFRPDHLTLTEPLAVHGTLSEGQALNFGSAVIRVIDTPGHTEGAISLLVEADGKRIIFCGDCISAVGQVWDLYSLQKGFSKGQRTIGGYHGFMGARWRLAESLEKIKARKASMLIPSHGSVMKDPSKAIDTLVARFETCYENYVGISALRHYFPELFADYTERPFQMPIRPGTTPPDCLRHMGTTWMLVSAPGAAFVMDVGSPKRVKDIEQMIEHNEIKCVEGLWVTHYHNDHTKGIPEFQKKFDVPCITDRRLAEVLENPSAWRLPCLMKEPIRVHKPMEDGHSWMWREFKLTSYNYPGQTLYHAALLVEHGALRMFFVGDSHTMSGNDDYCAYNRNLLGRDVGFQYCLSLIEKLNPTHIFNCHVADAFTFTPDEIAFMRKNLDRRESLFGELVSWDHANYGMDGSWVRCMPYARTVKPGEKITFDVVITNHSPVQNRFACRVVVPDTFGGTHAEWVGCEIKAKTEKALPLNVLIPEKIAAGRYVVLIDLQYGDKHLPRFTEMIVDVEG